MDARVAMYDGKQRRNWPHQDISMYAGGRNASRLRPVSIVWVRQVVRRFGVSMKYARVVPLDNAVRRKDRKSEEDSDDAIVGDRFERW